MMLGRGHKKTWHGSSRHEASRDITPPHDTSHPQLGSDRMVNTGGWRLGCHHASDLTIDLNHFLCWRLGWAGLGWWRGRAPQHRYISVSLSDLHFKCHICHIHTISAGRQALHAGALHNANGWIVAAWTLDTGS